MEKQQLDFHLTMEDYFKSKLTLFDKCKRGIINIDDEYGKLILKTSSCAHSTCSLKQIANYRATEIDYQDERGVKYKTRTFEKEIDIFCKVPGEF